MVLAVFLVGFWLESGKICKSNDHTCLLNSIALTLAGSLVGCLNNQPNGQVFKQLPWDPAKCMKKCVITIYE